MQLCYDVYMIKQNKQKDANGFVECCLRKGIIHYFCQMILNEFRKVKAFALDVDGVLTDGTIQVNERGEQLRTFNIKDGYAIQLAIKKGFEILIITGGRSVGTISRLQGLGVTHIYTDISDKLEVLTNWCSCRGLALNDMLYIGDDMPDLRCMEAVGIAVAPNDAAEEIKNVAQYISPINGGQGVVRELIEKVLKLNNMWYDPYFTKSK